MKIAIVGFPGCGKSTCFKAITQKTKDEVEKTDPTKPHLAAVKVEDPRLAKLKEFFNPKKTTQAEIVFEDLPGFNIPQIKEIEALMGVLGIFSGRDVARDVEDMETEFMLADLEVVNNRLGSLEKEIKKGIAEAGEEQKALIKCRESLEGNKGLRGVEFTAEEEKALRGFQLLSRKPLFFVGNAAEDRDADDVIKKLEDLCGGKELRCIEFYAKLEAEIADLEESEKESFLKELGIGLISRGKIVELAYSALNYITFFTVKGSETKAWPVKKGTTAIDAAGKIHSDIQKGFIKAEVISFNDLVDCGGSLQETKKKALLRLEGKEYEIKDGDIVDFRFNV